VSCYTLSKRSKQDIQGIVRYSVQKFGEMQTLNYMTSLENVLRYLAGSPDAGRSFTHRKTDEEYRYYPCVSHMVYYRKQEGGIFVVRILHGKMLPENHL
jgi:toxin ParE1/3/4